MATLRSETLLDDKTSVASEWRILDIISLRGSTPRLAIIFYYRLSNGRPFIVGFTNKIGGRYETY